MLVHHYHFTVYALDVPSLGLPAAAGGVEVMQAMQGHILAQGEVVGLYTLNPEVERPSGSSSVETVRAGRGWSALA